VRRADYQRAVEYIRALEHDPQATRGYELLSGEFLWSDEGFGHPDMPREAGRLLRDLSLYRGSVIRGKPYWRMSRLWHRLRADCPNWPGFRSERLDPALKPELAAEGDRHMAALEATFKRLGCEPTPPRRRWWQLWARTP
jgi:hypothetical protein